MLYRDICRTLAFYLWILLIPLTLPLGIAFYCDFIDPESFLQPNSFFAFLWTMVITALLAFIFWLIGRRSTGHLYRKEALLLVIIVYLLTPLIGSFPFLFNNTFSNPVDAYFEAVSGLTTTGATVMEAKKLNPATGEEIPIRKTFVTGDKTDYKYNGTIQPVVDPNTGKQLLVGIEAVSPSLLFWRSFLQWLGGGGIIVLFVAILPALGVGGKILFQSEVTGPSKESLMPRIKETASRLWKIYLGLTITEVILLLITSSKMSLFDAITISFSTLSTGGFTPRTGGIAFFNNGATDCVIMLFMILGSISFALYFFCMQRKFFRLKDPELRLFLIIILVAIVIATWKLFGKNLYLLNASGAEQTFTFWQALRYGAFQVISAQTSTGFTTANYDLWPFAVQVLMLNLMFIGGMAGSTAGGLKVVRQQTFFRIMLNKIESIFRPDTVRPVRIGKALISNRIAMTVLCYFMVAGSLTVLGTFLLVLDGIDPETGLSTIACMINNVGIAFRMGGPTDSFAFLSNFGKLLSCLWMIAGRLEFFTLLVAFVPAFWRSS